MKVLLLSSLCLSILGLGNGVSNGPLRITNGTVEEPHTSPWQVRLILGQSIIFWPCGGTLISKNYVLTAARCFNYLHILRTHGVLIYLGFSDAQQKNETGSLILETNVNYVTFHEGYNATTHENDIALIKLPNTIELSDTIQPVKLLSEDNVKLGQVSHITGYQYPYQEWTPDGNQYLHGGNVTVVDNSLCQKEYPLHVIDDNTICTSGTVAMCYGDEGAALPIDGEVVGITIGTKEVKDSTADCPIVPNSYLYIPKYLDWIKANSDYTD